MAVLLEKTKTTALNMLKEPKKDVEKVKKTKFPCMSKMEISIKRQKN